MCGVQSLSEVEHVLDRYRESTSDSECEHIVSIGMRVTLAWVASCAVDCMREALSPTTIDRDNRYRVLQPRSAIAALAEW